jgi:hypothetical protein
MVEDSSTYQDIILAFIFTELDFDRAIVEVFQREGSVQ